MLGLQNEREWALFCEQVLERPELATDERFASNSRRAANRDALRELITAAFAQLDSEQVLRRLDGAGIANARMNDMQAVWAHPQLAARERWQTIATPAGPVPALVPPGDTDTYRPRMDPVPALGEHTGAILAELGYASDEITALREAGAV